MYSEGDTVYIRDYEVGSTYKGIFIVPEMLQYRNQLAIITKAYVKQGIQKYKLNIDDGWWTWCDIWLAPYKSRDDLENML